MRIWPGRCGTWPACEIGSYMSTKTWTTGSCTTRYAQGIDDLSRFAQALARAAESD